MKTTKLKSGKLPQIRLVIDHTIKFIDISEKNMNKISMAERYGYLKQSMEQINKILKNQSI